MSLDALSHPTLHCKLRGRVSSTTIQYRNLKYASIPGRWQDSISYDTIPASEESIVDADTFGPSCPQKRGGQAWDLTLVGNIDMPLKDGHKGSEEEMDEFECLNVNVTVPKTATEGRGRSGTDLPVFVWVHGGGLSIGSNSWPQYDLTRFVERSLDIGKPVIGVSINYRIGILGFLASEELGIYGNYGYKDQALAFKWIKKHIAGFGGDPNNITAIGESAGGISLSTLLCANVGSEGLFEKVMIMSGEATLRKPRDRSWHEKMYQDQLEFLKLRETGVDERRRTLREMSVGELVSGLPLAQHFCGCEDGGFLKEKVTLSSLSSVHTLQHKPEWCKEFVIGDCAHDGTILKARILDNPNAVSLLKSLCSEHLTPSETASLLSAYNLSGSSSQHEQQSLLQLVSELRFYLPTLAAHSGWKHSRPSKRCHRYHFHVLNPVEGSTTGLSSHEFDIAYLFMNFNEHLNHHDQEVAQQMADHWIRFANGDGWCEEGSVVVIGDEGLVNIDEAVYDESYRGGRGKVLEMIGADKLWKLAEGWQGVRNDHEEHPIRGSL